MSTPRENALLNELGPQGQAGRADVWTGTKPCGLKTTVQLEDMSPGYSQGIDIVVQCCPAVFQKDFIITKSPPLYEVLSSLKEHIFFISSF